MKVVVHEIVPDRRRSFEGDDASVEQQILFSYPWLRSTEPEHRGDLDALLEHLDSTQMYSVEDVDRGGDIQLPPEESSSPVARPPLARAASFLAGTGVDPRDVRSHLWGADEDEALATLRAAKLPDDAAHRKALVAAAGMLGDDASSTAVPAPATPVDAIVHEHGADVAEAVRSAIAAGDVKPVQLGGKHSAGTLLARAGGQHWLLKPGAGGQSSASGAAEEHASQAAREGAFYHAVRNWGIIDVVPRAEWLRIGGEEYAALHFLPRSFKTVADLRQADPNAARRIFDPYLRSGALHQWAVAYFVLGETDGHAKNVMADPNGRVALIDHGSALAGVDFDPARDRRSFVPCFLRAWAPDAYNNLAPADKMRYLPRVSERTSGHLKTWLDGLSVPEMEHTLARYSVDPAPSLDRLTRVKSLALQIPVDQAINRLWVTT